MSRSASYILNYSVHVFERWFSIPPTDPSTILLLDELSSLWVHIHPIHLLLLIHMTYRCNVLPLAPTSLPETPPIHSTPFENSPVAPCLECASSFLFQDSLLYCPRFLRALKLNVSSGFFLTYVCIFPVISF